MIDVGFAGEYRAVVSSSDGEVIYDSGYQRNLILNQGLNFFGGTKGSEFNAGCVIGSGNTTPAITQTLLDSFVAGVGSGTDLTRDYSYVDKGDGLYRLWEQKKYRFAGLVDKNISEVGLVSQYNTSSKEYYLTTRALIKDSAGLPTTITVRAGEVLDIYYKIHKVIDVTDKDFVVNMSDGDGGLVPYNVKVRPCRVGTDSWSISNHAAENPGNGMVSAASRGELSSIVSSPSGTETYYSYYNTAYVEGSFELTVNKIYGLDNYTTGIRTAFGYYNNFYRYQMRYGKVSDDTMIEKTNRHTLTIPHKIKWGRFEGVL